MITLFRILKNDSRFRYLLVGGSSVMVEYGIFWILISGFHVNIVVGNVISFLVGFVYTFLLHNKWSFSGNHIHSVKKQFVSYGLLAGINVVATSLIISIEVNILNISPLIAKVISMALVVAWNYLLLNKVIFQREKTQRSIESEISS